MSDHHDAARADDSWNLVDLARAIRRSAGLLVISFALALAAAWALASVQTPSYRATASILIEERDAAAPSVALGLVRLGGGGGEVDNERQILASRLLAAETIDRLGLEDDPELSPEPGLFAEFANWMGFEPKPPAEPREALIDAFLERLDIGRAGDSAVIEASYRSKQASRAALIANAHAASFLLDRAARDDAARRLERARRDAEQALLDERIARQREQAAAARSEAATAARDMAAASAAIQELERRRAAASIAFAAKEELARALRGGAPGGDALDGLKPSPILENLKVLLVGARQRDADLAGRYGPRHPTRLDSAQEIRALEARLAGERARLAAEAEAERRLARSALRDVEAALARARGAPIAGAAQGAAIDAERALVGLEQSARALAFERAAFERAAAAETAPDARVISPATAPDHPAFPKRAQFLAAATCLWTVAAFAAVYRREASDATFRTADQLARFADLPVIAVLPEITRGARRRSVPRAPHEAPLAAPSSPYAAACRDLLTTALARAGASTQTSPRAPLDALGLAEAPAAFASAPAKTSPEDGVAIGIASADPGEGSASCALTLARLAALSGRRTLLVDVDYRHAAIAPALGLSPTFCLADVLEDRCPPVMAGLADPKTPLAILPALARARSGSQRPPCYRPERLAQLIGEARRHYHVVVVELGPVFGGDALWAAAAVDLRLFLARWGATARGRALAALDELEAAARGGPIALALTEVDLARHKRWGVEWSTPIE